MLIPERQVQSKESLFTAKVGHLCKVPVNTFQWTSGTEIWRFKGNENYVTIKIPSINPRCNITTLVSYTSKEWLPGLNETQNVKTYMRKMLNKNHFPCVRYLNNHFVYINLFVLTITGWGRLYHSHFLDEEMKHSVCVRSQSGGMQPGLGSGHLTPRQWFSQHIPWPQEYPYHHQTSWMAVIWG